jgi:isovaleryl-CoA dehydrogenase
MSGSFREDIKSILESHDPEGNTFALYEGVEDFTRGVVRPLDNEIDLETHAFPHPLWQQMGENGLLGIMVPEEYGGLGLGYLPLAAVTTQISKASGSIGLSHIAHVALCTHQILRHGTKDQKEKYLPGLASGERIGALAMSETDAGSDVMGMNAHAKKVDGGYVINGAKMWITNGARVDAQTGEKVTADVLVLYAVTNDSPKKLTAFIVDGGTDGFKAGQKIHKEGMRGSETWEVVFDNCFVPDANVLGQPDKGAHVLMAGLNAERLILGAGALGLAEAACVEATAYLHQRPQFGMTIAFNQSVALDLADIYSQILCGYDHLYSAAARADRNINSLTNSAAASVFLRASRAATYAAEQNVYYHGGNGQTIEYRAGRVRRDASLYRVGGGSEFVRELRIAQDLVPDYAAHLKLAALMRAAFANATGVPAANLEEHGIADAIAKGLLIVTRAPKEPT